MIKIIKPAKDTFITNAIVSVRDTAENSNMGLAGALSIFHFSGTNNLQLIDINQNSRILMEFDLESLDSYVDVGMGSLLSATYYLQMFDAPVNEFLPGAFHLVAQRVSGSWLEGNGFDLQAYSQLGAVNWLSRSVDTPWVNPGGDLYPSPFVSQSFSNGYENLYINITSLVTSSLLDGEDKLNICIKLNDEEEQGAYPIDYKVFYSKDSPNELMYPRLIVGSSSDVLISNRAGITLGSTGSLFITYAPNGSLQNIPDVNNSDDVLAIQLSSSIGYLGYSSGSYVKTGFYEADIFIPYTQTLSAHIAASGSILFYDTWTRPSDNAEVYRGEFRVFSAVNSNLEIKEYKSSMPKLKPEYMAVETPMVRLFIQDDSLNKTPVPRPQSSISSYLPGLRYEVRRADNNALIIEASDFTQLSSHEDGSFFWFPMSNLAEGYLYEFNFYYQLNGQLIKLNKNGFQFKVNVNTRA
jgi:hypothetical protein